MRDPYDPTDEELREWAYAVPRPLQPVQDFDLMVTTERRGELLLSLAADLDCPSHAWFLHCLYLLVGDAVRSQYGTSQRARIEQLVASGRASVAPTVQRWCERSEDLLAHPEQFSYEQWCSGGLAREHDDG